MKYIRQEGLVDCGICCLQNIIKYYKGNIDLEKLRKMTNTNENGTSIYNLVKTSNEVGLISKAFKCNVSDLYSLRFPLIALIRINNYNHFIIIDDIDNDRVKIFDPIRGKLNYSFNDFSKEWQKIIITFDPTKNIVKEKNNYISFLYYLIINNKKEIIILLIISFLCSIFGLLFSFIIKTIIDNRINSSSFLLFSIVILLLSISEYIKYNLSINLNNKIDYDLSTKIYNKIFSLPLLHYHSRPIGDMTSKINDFYVIRDFISIITSSSVIDILCSVLILLIVLFISIRLFLLFILFTFLYISIYYYFKRDELRFLSDVKDKEAYCNSTFIERLLGIDTIKHLNLENKVIEKQNNNKKNYLDSLKKYSSSISLQLFISTIIENYGIIIILFMGIYLYNKKIVSIGEITLIYSFFILYFNSIKNLFSLYKNFNRSQISFRRINTLLNIDKEEYGNKNIKSINTIIFNNISYSYNQNKLISKFNLTINKGDYVLINGGSGNGKSTLFKLLNKEEILKEGEILIDNISINEIKVSSLRDNICFVSQNEYIFTDNIKNNIVLYKNISNKELEKVLKVCLIDKLLKKRNINLDYILEENGHNLSGGEREKIIIARALLRKTDYIVFDCSMEELDIKTERKIIENIKNEYDKTIILVSHRTTNEDLFNKRLAL